MKIGRAFSIFVCLLISLQICDAVICPTGNDKSKGYIRFFGRENCAGACAYIECGVFTRTEAPMHYFGCENVIQKCRKHGHEDKFTEEFEFINQHNPNALMFKNHSFIYISGCGNEEEGHKCLQKKYIDFHSELDGQELRNPFGPSYNKVYWHSSDDGVKGNGSLGNGNSPNDGAATSDNGNGSSASYSQNGAITIVGIVLILVAAWIY